MEYIKTLAAAVSCTVISIAGPFACALGHLNTSCQAWVILRWASRWSRARCSDASRWICLINRVGGCACDRVIAGLAQPTKTLCVRSRPRTITTKTRSEINGIFYCILLRIRDHGQGDTNVYDPAQFRGVSGVHPGQRRHGGVHVRRWRR